MTITEKRVAANRANAKNSTGPRSPLGKIISSLNSQRHRVLEATVVLENESSKRFVGLLNSFFAHYNPSDPIECMLIERMAVCQWRLLRMWAIETADFRHEHKKQSADIIREDAPTRAALALRDISSAERHPDPVGRKEGRYSREFYLAFDALNRHRERKRRDEATYLPDSKVPAQPDEPIILTSEPTSNLVAPASSNCESTPSGVAA